MPHSIRDTGWFKSSRSGAGTDNCVEVRIVLGATVGVRDSKNRGSGTLWITPLVWESFIGATKAGDFDLLA